MNEPLSKKVARAFVQSDLIISGKVIGVKSLNNEKNKSSADPVVYTVEIIRTIKGKYKKEVVEIISRLSGASCGYKFELGRSYLIYARRSSHFSSKTKNEFDFTTSLCDRNQNLKSVKKKELRKLKKLNFS